MATDFEKYMANMSSGKTNVESGGTNYSLGTVSVIVPVQNVEMDINGMIRFIHQNWNQSWGALEVVIADNKSADRTVKFARYNADWVSTTRKNAIGACIRNAVNHARGDYRLVISPSRLGEIRRSVHFLEWLREGYDLVLGNRFTSDTQNRYRGNLPAQIARRFSDRRLAPSVNDIRSGFIGFTRNSGRLLYTESTIDGLGSMAEIIGTALKMGLKIREIPLTSPDSPPVYEKLQFSTTLKLIADSIRTQAKWKKNPISLYERVSGQS